MKHSSVPALIDFSIFEVLNRNIALDLNYLDLGSAKSNGN